MPTTLTNGIQLPDKGSVDWYSSMQSNYNLIDTHLGDTDVHVTAEDKARWDGKQGSLSQAQLDAIAQVATNTSDIATLQSGKADASHTHSSSDITDIGDYATKQYVDNSISGLVDNAPDALNTLNELSAALNDDSNFASTVTTALATKANSADLATVATSGSYTDLSNKPTINDSTITIQKNGSTVDTFTTNGSNKTINIPVPTKTSDLTNDSDFVVSSSLAAVATSGFYNDLDNKPYIPDKISDLIDDSNFVDTSNPAVSSGITSAKVTDYDTHIADTDIHVTTADKNKWNNQTYVFRYSSTALTASSTNSNALLDNTDNLKVGDKVIDSSGVLFSITAIDTENSTFTIGTALIDLAQDSDVVHTSGNETVDGVKTITGSSLDFKSTSAEYGVSAGDSSVIFRDKNNRQTFKIYSRVFYSGIDNNLVSFFLTQKVDNTYYTSNGIQLLANTGNKDVILRPIPANNNADGLSVSLGASDRRWSKIYGTEYYYGSNNVEFSTKFVTTDTNQTISGSKTFTDLVIYNSDTTAYASYLTLRNQRNARGSSETGVQGIQYIDKNGKTLTMLESRVISNGNTGFNIICYNIDGNNQSVSDGVSVIKSPTTTTLAPTTDNAVTCGRALAKWSDVVTYKVNGVEPSALSLPSDRSARIDISSYITNLGNGGNNQYIVPANGYIWLHFTSINSALCYSQTSGGLTNYAQTFVRYSGDGQLYAFFPVRKNDYFIVQIYTSSTAVVQSAYFIPCQGNV